MTLGNVEKHLERLAKASKLDIDDLGVHAKASANLGLQEFWGAHDWNFRCVDIELSLSSSADSYTLPDNFDQIRSIREKTTTSGFNLTYYVKDDFDALAPKLSAVTSGTPVAYTIFRSEADGKWKIAFLPKLSGALTLYANILTTPPSGLGGMPSKFHGGVLAFGAKHLYPHSNAARRQAVIEAYDERDRLIHLDQLNVGRITQLPDDTEGPVDFQYEWVK